MPPQHLQLRDGRSRKPRRVWPEPRRFVARTVANWRERQRFLFARSSPWRDAAMTARPHFVGDAARPANASLRAPWNRSDFAWEFLRRNPRYRHVARASRATRGIDEDAKAQPWGLQFLSNPDLPTGLAEVFWRPEVAPGLVVRLQRVPPDFGRALVVGGNLARQRLAPNGLHLKFLSGLQAHVPEGDLQTPLAVVLPVTGSFSTHLRAAGGFQRSLDGLAAPIDDLTVQQRIRLERTLRAFDGAQAQQSYRVIAEQVFGADAIGRHAWRTSPVRDTAIRLVRSGRALVNGAYLNLLRSAR